MDKAGDTINPASTAAPNNGTKKKDALSVLMQTAKYRSNTTAKRRRTSSTTRAGGGGSFVECPAGCGKQVLESIINVHLDRCPVLLLVPRQDDDEEDADGGGKEGDTSSFCSMMPDTNGTDALDRQDAEAKTHHERTTQTCQSERREEDGSCSPQSPPLVTQDHASSSGKKTARPTPGGDRQTQVDWDDVRASRLPLMDDVPVSPMSVPCEGSSAASPEPASTATTVHATPAASDGAAPSTSSPASEEERLPPSAPTIAMDSCLEAQEAQLPSKTSSTNGAARRNGIPDAFSLMMERSKLLYSQRCGSSSHDVNAIAVADANPIQQCLYLSSDGGLRVTLLDGVAKPPPSMPVAWSAVVVLKDRPVDAASTIDDPNTDPISRKKTRRPVELTIATDFPSADVGAAPPTTGPTRFVRHHSRLSVPVLKSVLQKSIRRRRPLPSVRVAMELADKSFGDLIRRLPVMILEDSMLHPDVDLLIWLMVAHSKEYVIPRPLMTRVFQIVFEVASCQWKDDEKIIAHETALTTSFGSTDNLCLNTLHSTGGTEPSAHLSPSIRRSNQLVWSLLVRAEYGGMRCDVEMLHRFARLWHARFRSPGVPTDLVKRWGVALTNGPPSWRDIPFLLHERAAQHGADRVDPLVVRGITSLAFEDIAVEGVDFHCSPILDHLFSLPVAKLCSDLLVLSGTNETSESPGRPSTANIANPPKMSLDGFFRHCLWNYSSGVNRRQPLLPLLPGQRPRVDSTESRPDYEEMWRQLVADEALRYQSSFILERLARNAHA